MKDDKLGIALVGLGKYSEEQLAPALKETKYCYLAGIVTGSEEKAETWSKKYRIPDKNIYNYNNFDSIDKNEAIDIVYVVLPNALHATFTIRAAAAGKHVICEKPMALTVRECEQMIQACSRAKRSLSIGYRLHFDPFNKEIMRLGQNRVYGPVTKIEAANGGKIGEDPGQWRLNRGLAGGGSLMDLGIYTIQACRYTTGKEPLYATVIREEKNNPGLFNDIEDTLHFELEFPNKLIAQCMCSYSEKADRLHVETRDGWFKLDPAFYYNKLKGRTSKGKMDFPQVNQQALQMDDFAYRILTGKSSPVPGEEGLKDMQVIEAIYEALKTQKPVPIGAAISTNN